MAAMLGRFGLGGAADFTRRLLLDFFESDDCDLGSIQLWRADYEAVAKRLGWREHHPSWDVGGDLLCIPLDRDRESGVWFAVWRSEIGSWVNGQELCGDMRDMYWGDEGVTLVWPTGVKAEYNADAEAHNEELDRRLRRPIEEAIIIDLEDETPTPTSDAYPRLLGTWEPKEKTNYIYLYFDDPDAAASNKPTEHELAIASPPDSDPSATDPSSTALSASDPSAADSSAINPFSATDSSAADSSATDSSAVCTDMVRHCFSPLAHSRASPSPPLLHLSSSTSPPPPPPPPPLPPLTLLPHASSMQPPRDGRLCRTMSCEVARGSYSSISPSSPPPLSYASLVQVK
jgi:hypothetical protein